MDASPSPLFFLTRTGIEVSVRSLSAVSFFPSSPANKTGRKAFSLFLFFEHAEITETELRTFTPLPMLQNPRPRFPVLLFPPLVDKRFPPLRDRPVTTYCLLAFSLVEEVLSFCPPGLGKCPIVPPFIPSLLGGTTISPHKKTLLRRSPFLG